MIKAIASIDAEAYRVKESREKTMLGRLLYAPKLINSHMLEGFLYQQPYQWNTPERRLRVTFEHEDQLSGTPHGQLSICDDATRLTVVTFTTDGIKNKVALEVQLGKYSFVEYDICAKLPVYKRFDRIECAIEVLPMNSLVRKMSTGPGWFERTATILANRGYNDLDVPVLLLGIDA